MNTILVILAIATVLAIAIVILQKTGKIKDEDGDLIPDVVEDKVEEVKAETKRRVKRVKQELKDVKKSAKDLKEQIVDVAEAAGGSNRKGRKSTKPTKSSLRVMKKDELLKLAKKDFKVELDSNLTKTNLVNKVYGLYHKK